MKTEETPGSNTSVKYTGIKENFKKSQPNSADFTLLTHQTVATLMEEIDFFFLYIIMLNFKECKQRIISLL